MAKDKYKEKKSKDAVVPDAPKKDYSFFHERLDPLGWLPEHNTFTVPLWRWDKNVDSPIKPGAHDYKEYTRTLFDVDERGNITIPYYTIHGVPVTFTRKGNALPTNYVQKRLVEEWVDEKGKKHKYHNPKGGGTPPWFPPRLIKAYEEARQIETLYMTEGVFKAFVGALHGQDILALLSISTQRDKSISALHEDITRLIRRCKPKNIVWLVDGDCRRLPKGWPEVDKDADGKEVDLFKRPNDFFTSCFRVRELLKDLQSKEHFEIYFMAVNSESVPVGEKKESPKGLDDLMIEYADQRADEAAPLVGEGVEGSGQWTAEQRAEEVKHARVEARRKAMHEVVEDVKVLSRPNRFFHRVPMDRMQKVKDFFAVDNQLQFYKFYLEERFPDKLFIYNGTKFKWEAEKKELQVISPAQAKDYMRIGTKYYRLVRVPNQFGQLRERLEDWDRVSIKEDWGDGFLKHVARYVSFCNRPDHVNYQRVVSSCYNLYHPLPYEPAEDDGVSLDDLLQGSGWSVTYAFLKHIFGETTVSKPHPTKTKADGTPEMMTVTTFDMGLDYLQLTYTQPTQKLPILCLTSEWRGTGKTTFAEWLQDWLGNNATSVGNKDLVNDFNAHFIAKNVMIVEESKVEKQVVVDELKFLSTATIAQMNTKGVSQREVDVFLKIIMNTNNVTDFIRTDDKETRFWVLTIPPIPASMLNVSIIKDMHEEIPVFLRMLSKRSMKTENLYRAWFDPSLLETEALQRVREHSRPTARKLITRYFKQLFESTGVEEMYYTTDDVWREVFNSSTRYDEEYVSDLLTDMGFQVFTRNGKIATTRYRIPKWEHDKAENTRELHFLKITDPRRPLVITRETFWPDEAEWKLVKEEHPACKNGLLGVAGPTGLNGTPTPAHNGQKELATADQDGDNEPF